MPRRRDRVRRFERPEQPRGEAADRGEELRAARRAEYPAADDVPRGRAECESRAGAVTLATEPQSTQRKTMGHRDTGTQRTIWSFPKRSPWLRGGFQM